MVKKLSFACFIQFMPTHATLRVDVGLRDFLCVKKLIFLKLLSKIELMIANWCHVASLMSIGGCRLASLARKVIYAPNPIAGWSSPLSELQWCLVCTVLMCTVHMYNVQGAICAIYNNVHFATWSAIMRSRNICALCRNTARVAVVFIFYRNPGKTSTVHSIAM